MDLVIEVGDGAGNFQDAIISAGAEVQFAHGDANEFLRILGELAVLLEMACGHARVAVSLGIARKSLLLFLAPAGNAFADRCRVSSLRSLATSRYSTAGTSMCRSMRSSNGPEMR